MDILVYTPLEIEKFKTNKYNIISIALKNGVSVYEREC